MGVSQAIRETEDKGESFRKEVISMVTYKGCRQSLSGLQHVYRDGEILYPEPSRKIRDHSTEFNWGYRGSGPAQLALALLLDATKNKDLSEQLHQPFKDQFVAVWDDNWAITGAEIYTWVETELLAWITRTIDIEGLTNKPTGIGRIDRGECPMGGTNPMSCMFCLYGHMLDCHHPYTCAQANCSHNQGELEQEL